MNGRPRIRLLRAACLLAFCWLSLPQPAAAQTWLQQDTVITFTPLAAQPLGRSVGVSLTLTDTQGTPLPYRQLEVFLGSDQAKRARTNSEGVAKVRLEAGLSAGQYTLNATFAGYENYLSSSATTTFVVAPAVLTVRTVPPLAGVKFLLGGRAFSTAADGSGQISVSESGRYHLEVLPWRTKAARATFIRWDNGIFEAGRNVTLPRDSVIGAGFNVEQLVTPTFVDLEQHPVSARRVSTVTFKSSYGTTESFGEPLGGVKPVWVQASQVVRRPTGLEAKKISYVLESVMIDGSNVVNRGQQRFLVNREGWNLKLLLYDARFQAVDALFGFPLGTGVTLEYPDGHTKLLRFGAADQVATGPLARGLYKVQVVGAQGMAPLTPVALSRDQAVELKVLSRLDMGVGLGLGLALALSLLLLGRPQLIGLKRRGGFSEFPERRRTPPRQGRHPSNSSEWR